MPILTGAKFDRLRESQKTIVIIEFPTLDLCRVRNFIKIETFAVFRPKLWPKRWQVPILTGVKIDRRQKLQKPIVTIKFTVLDLCWIQNFIKIEALSVLRPNLWPKRWQVSRITEDYCHQWIQHLQIVHYVKFRDRWLTSFPVPRSTLPVPRSPF